MNSQKGSGEVIVSLVVAIFVIGLVLFNAFSVKVLPSEVAIIIDMYGSDKGVQIETLPTGRNFYNVITHDVITYPAYIQQGQYEDMSFQDVDGLILGADISIDYKFVEENIPQLYLEYRKGPSTIISTYFPTWIKNALVQQASKYQVDEVYGSKKEEFRQSVLTQLREEFGAKGIHIDNLYFTNGIEIPSSVKSRINAKIEATQLAQQKENELQATQADVEKQVAVEEGKARSRIIEAESRARANTILSNSLTANVLRFKELENDVLWMEAWDGKVPVTVLGADTGVLLNR